MPQILIFVASQRFQNDARPFLHVTAEVIPDLVPSSSIIVQRLKCFHKHEALLCKPKDYDYTTFESNGPETYRSS